MGGPWERYASTEPATDGPWNKYKTTAPSTSVPSLRSASGVTQPLSPENVYQTVPPPIPPELQNTFASRAGERLRQNIYAIPEAIEGTSYGQGLTQPKAIEEAKQERTAQAAAARQMVFGGATSIPGKVAMATTIGPRMAYDLVKQYWQDPATLAGDVAAMAPVLAEAKMPTRMPSEMNIPGLSKLENFVSRMTGGKSLPAVPTQEAISPEQAKMTAAIDKANAPYIRSLAAEDLAQRQRGLAERIQENVQETHEAVRGSLNGRSEALRGRMVQANVPGKPIMDAIDKSRQMLAGVPDDLRIFKELTDAIDQNAAEATAARVTPEGIAPPTQGGIPFNDARIQSTALGEKWSAASGNLRRALKNVYDTYRNQLQSTADAAGTGQEYRALADDWHQYFEDWQGRTPLNQVLNAPHPAYVTPIAKGVGSELLEQQLSRYKEAGAVPESVAEMRAVTKQAEVPPLEKIKIPTPPPPVQPLGGIRKTIVRTAGGMAGAAAGTLAGVPPWIGWHGGAEGAVQAVEAARAARAARTMPPIPTTPEEYMRTMLDAKEGKISPGELERRIKKGGGKMRVTPIPQPP